MATDVAAEATEAALPPPEETPSADAIADAATPQAALDLLGHQSWAAQETCSVTLTKLLDNVSKNPGEAKFRCIKRSNAAIKSKVLDCPGGTETLLAAGFIEEDDAYKFPAEAPLGQLEDVLAALRQQATDNHMNHLRALRDEKIAKEKADEAKLNEFGGFSRGRHHLRGGGGTNSGSNADTPAA